MYGNNTIIIYKLDSEESLMTLVNLYPSKLIEKCPISTLHAWVKISTDNTLIFFLIFFPKK